ncbi:MAG TPA: uroporphyrinogen-III synthase [Xanthobacteraceae bacterium]|jgi:uroporphyrinogen-III synthase
MRLLVTRPPPEAERTAAALRARGHEVTVASLLRIEPVEFAVGGLKYGAVVMTSANAARMLEHHRQRDAITLLPAVVVGRHTAEAARAAGFKVITSADGDKEELAGLLRRRFAESSRPLLYLAAQERAAELADCGVRVDTVVVYRAVKIEVFPLELTAALPVLDGVMHFSRRSAEAYLECADHARVLEHALGRIQFCLSQQVAEPLAAAGAADIRVPARPTAAALLELVEASRSPSPRA